MLLNSKIIGSGNHVLIVLHGFLGMLDNWKTFAKKMNNEFISNTFIGPKKSWKKLSQRGV